MLVIFEGPDGVGKTTLARKLCAHLEATGQQAVYCAFPGKEPGTLGQLVNEIHHYPLHAGITGIDATALQLLHVAAHVDTYKRVIHPMLASGTWVILDRSWLSTYVYGRLAGADLQTLSKMLDIEQLYWSSIDTPVLFLLDRSEPGRAGLDRLAFEEQRAAYGQYAPNLSADLRLSLLNTNESLANTFNTLLQCLNLPSQSQVSSGAAAKQLPASRKQPRKGLSFSKLSPAEPSKVYETYWRFAAARQQLFFKRWAAEPAPWTSDPILNKFKFTNAYRASDRTSQYLIKYVAYSGSQEPDEIFFRIILFKLFNKIDTWKLLVAHLGLPETKSFDLDLYDVILTEAKANKPIYSGAYIMPSGGKYGDSKKHLSHLRLLKQFLADGVPLRIQEATKLRQVFEILRSYPMMGDFLAFQYAIDLNYSNICSFSEMEFVVPGPGARDGIRKCFRSTGGLNEADLIRVVTDMQEEEFSRLGLEFPTLWGRKLQLIDCQNLFCEVDKYARLAHPDVLGISGRTKIKQSFKSAGELDTLWYPPKWGINDRVAEFLEHRYEIA